LLPRRVCRAARIDNKQPDAYLTSHHTVRLPRRRRAAS
jgi:hypothetical protein